MRWLLLPPVLALAACAHKPAPAPAGAAAPPARAAQPEAARAPAPPPSPLAAEQRWMHGLFAGTPVQLDNLADGSLRVQLPLAHAYEPQDTTPKAPLRAVLDRLGQSLARQPGAQLHLGPPGPAARERLAALRAHLGAQGVAPQRLPATAPLASDKVLLRLAPAPGAVQRVDDAALPAQQAWPKRPAK
jgi:uncharacterized protein (DUF2267 family)